MPMSVPLMAKSSRSETTYVAVAPALAPSSRSREVERVRTVLRVWLTSSAATMSPATSAASSGSSTSDEKSSEIRGSTRPEEL